MEENWENYGAEAEAAADSDNSGAATSTIVMINTPSRKKPTKRSSLEEEDFLSLLHGSDPVKIELNRIQNEVKGLNLIICLICFSNF